jgi:putative glutamine transport system substrate-binding protein
MQLLIACNLTGSSLEIIGPPNPCEIPAGKIISLGIKGSLQTDIKVAWSAGLGNFSSVEGLSTVYTAPQVTEDTPVIITARITANGENKINPRECIIKAAPSTSTPNDSSPNIPAATPTTATSESTYQQVIKKNLRFTAIVRNDCSVFSCNKNDKLEGFEIDIMREFARRWFGNENSVNFLRVDSADRIPTLIQSKGDIIAATLTITKNRQEVIDFSGAYYQDGQRILIHVTSSGTINGPCDLEGRIVGVVEDSSGIEGIKSAIRNCSPSFSINEKNLVKFPSDQPAIEALEKGEIHAFTTDGILLEQLAGDNKDLKVVGNDFTTEPYGFGVRKESDDRFLRLVNTTLQEMQRDRTYEAIYCSHFGEKSHPYPISIIAGEIPGEFQSLVSADPTQKISNSCSYDELPEKHSVKKGEWLSKISKMYYGDSSPDYWMFIYNKNKELIGNNPDKIKEGMQLEIHPLPPNFTPSVQP